MPAAGSQRDGQECSVATPSVTRSERAARLVRGAPRLEWMGTALTLFASALAACVVLAANEGLGPLARPEFSLITSLPIAVYPVLAAAALALVMVRRHWWMGIVLFFTWIPLEDLARKFTNNDLRLYFIKDGILAIAFIGVLPRLRGCWRAPMGDAWFPSMALLATAVVMAIPAAAHDVQLPLVAFQARFLFVLLLPIGVYIGLERERLGRTLFALTLLTSAVCSLGVVQAVVGPAFLNPSLNNSPFQHLAVEKTVGAVKVLRPSGPFADVSRFASWTIIAVVIAICSTLIASSTPRRRVSMVAVAIALTASFASASRAAFLLTVPIAMFAFVVRKETRLKVRPRAVLLTIVALFAIATAGGRIGEVYRHTLDFFAVTINPWSARFDLASRVWNYIASIYGGLLGGHWIGTGTGMESLGRRYLGASFGATNTESGWGSVGAEWGLAGLLLWVLWTAAWLRAMRRSVLAASSHDKTVTEVLALYLGLYLIVLFSLGIGSFENYVANAFFWFFSGLIFAARVSATVLPAATGRGTAGNRPPVASALS